MATEFSISQLSQRLSLELRREEMLTQGRSDAFRFVHEHSGDVAQIQSEIEKFEDYVANPPQSLRRAMSPNTTVRLHAEGYIPGLKDALRIVLDGKANAPSNGGSSDDALPERIADALHYEEYVFKGRSDAFHFAQKCEGHIGVLRAAILKSERFLSRASGAVKPELSQRFNRRHYEDGYLAGLKDALQILLQAEAREPQLAAVAEPRANDYDATSHDDQATAADPTQRDSATYLFDR